MAKKKRILAIIGSASSNSANLKLAEHIQCITDNVFEIIIFNELKTLPHFDPELSLKNPPIEIVKFRNLIQNADGIILSTPEYIFSIPSGLKNAIEWCIATTIFTDKPCGIITASANGIKGHEELQLIMKTALARCSDSTNLLIQGIRGKFDNQNNLIDKNTYEDIGNFIESFVKLLDNTPYGSVS